MPAAAIATKNWGSMQMTAAPSASRFRTHPPLWRRAPALPRVAVGLGGACLALALSACSTTDEQVTGMLEQVAASEIDSGAWQQAADQLSAVGRPAARQLIAQLNPDHYLGPNYREYRDEQEKLRTGAARALGRIKPRGATAALDDRVVVGYTDPERIACMWAIGEIGFSQLGYDALRVQLKDKNPLIRLHAAIGILKMDEEDGVGQIDSALAGDDAQLVGVALQGIEESNYSGVPLLARLLQEGEPRQEELRGVVDRVREQLVGQLDAEEPLVRQRSARGLGTLGDHGARDALARLLDDANNLVRFNAAAALAIMDDERGTEFLFSALESEDPILRSNAVTFLTRVQRNSGTVQERLVATLAGSEALSRAGAAQVLGQAAVTEAVQPLLAATEDSAPEVRCSAVIALGTIGAASSRARLEALLDDRDPTVSYYAEWALRRLDRS